MKYRTEERTRMVPETRDGKTHMVPQTYTERIPVAPQDWDAIALGAVRVAAVLAVAGAVTWSTVAIGDLLSGVAPVWTSYLVAGVFDLAWVICMVLEWLSRYDRDRAALPVVCGWVALAVSVSLITLHGASDGGTALVQGAADWSGRGTIFGACGGAVSVMAKGMWAVVMRHTAVEMDPASAAWLEAERREMNSALATVAARRQLARTQSRTQAEVLALSAGQPDTWTAVPVQGRTPDKGRDTLSVPETVPVLTQDRTPDKGQDRSSVRVSVPDSRTDDLSGKISHRAFVRGLLSADPDLSDTDLSAALRSEYGQDTKTDSIRKAIQRARGDLSRTA
jgi:hypothetical protein